MVMASECSMVTAASGPPPLVGPLACSLDGSSKLTLLSSGQVPCVVLVLSCDPSCPALLP
jgi:hypothetical protein